MTDPCTMPPDAGLPYIRNATLTITYADGASQTLTATGDQMRGSSTLTGPRLPDIQSTIEALPRMLAVLDDGSDLVILLRHIDHAEMTRG